MELSIDRLTKHYGRKIAVDCVSATLTPGVYGLLGANGAGKTRTINTPAYGWAAGGHFFGLRCRLIHIKCW